MEVRYEVFCVFKFSGREPQEFFICVFIAKPTDKVEQPARLASVNFGVKDFSNFILKFTLNVDRRGQRLYMVQNFIWNSGFQHGNMEHRVHTTDGVRKTESYDL